MAARFFSGCIGDCLTGFRKGERKFLKKNIKFLSRNRSMFKIFGFRKPTYFLRETLQYLHTRSVGTGASGQKILVSLSISWLSDSISVSITTALREFLNTTVVTGKVDP